MNFPPIIDPVTKIVVSDATLSVDPAEVQGPSQVPAPPDEAIDVWQYFAENVDDFAVAKVIVDHFDANPKDLQCPAIEVDAYGLYLRAKLTLKRQHIAYAEAQAALTKARENSRRLVNAAKAAGSFFGNLRRAIASQPEVLVMALAGVAYYLTR